MEAELYRLTENLGLSEAQMEQAAQLLEKRLKKQYASTRAALKKAGLPDDFPLGTLFSQGTPSDKKFEEDLQAILDPEQKEKWEAAQESEKENRKEVLANNHYTGLISRLNLSEEQKDVVYGEVYEWTETAYFDNEYLQTQRDPAWRQKLLAERLSPHLDETQQKMLADSIVE